MICLRKFLELEDDVLAIYDETRKKDYQKHENRLAGLPDEAKKIDSKGKPIYSDSEDSEEI